MLPTNCLEISWNFFTEEQNGGFTQDVNEDITESRIQVKNQIKKKYMYLVLSFISMILILNMTM